MTQITLKGLHPDTDYAVQLRVHDGERVSGWSRKFPLHTITNSKKPKVPTNVIWVPSDDSFIGEWDIVTENESDKPSNVVRYEVELRNPSLVSKFVSVPQITSGTRVVYELTKAKNTSLFGTAQTELSFRVRAVNHKDIKSDWTNWLNADQSAPTVPTNFVATGITEGIDLTWDLDPTTKTKKYELHVGLTAGFTPTAANMIFSGYADKASYYTGTYQVHYFKLFAVSAFGLKSSAATANAEPISPYGADVTPPSVPTSLAASVVRSGESAIANLTWVFNETTAGNEDIQAFVVKWRKVGATPYFMEYAEKDARSLSIALPQPYADYEFQIASVDRTANYSAFSTPPVTLSGAIPGPPPQTTGVTAIAGLDSLQLSWAASTHDDVKYGGYYEVQIAKNSGFTTGLLTYQTGNTSITVSGLDPTTLYYYRVRAVDVTAQTGTYSTTGSATTDSFPVVELSDGNPPASSPTPTVSGGLGYITAMWSPVANNDPVTYEVHLGTGSAAFAVSAATKVAEIAGTMMFIRNLPGTTTPLSYGTNYYVRLIAKDVDGAAAVGTGSAAVQTLKSVIGDITLSPADIGAPTIAQAQGYASTAQTNAINTAATDAQTKATAAETAAKAYTDTRETAITSAYQSAITTSASGKNKITHSTAAASGANTAGDTWFQYNAQDQVIAQWRGMGGSTWVSETVNSNVIANLDVAKLTTGTIASAVITINTTGQIKSQDYVSGSAGWSLSNGGLQINNGVVDAKVMKAGTSFTNNLFVASTIQVGNASTTGYIQSYGYTAGVQGFSLSKTGLVIEGTGNAIAAAAINVGKVQASQIETSQLVITQTQVTGLAGALTTATTNAENNIKTLWGHPSNTTLIDGGDIYTNTVRANALTVGDFTNYIADGDLLDPNFINWGAGMHGLARVAGSAGTPPYMKWNAALNANAHVFNNYFFEVRPGDSFYFSGEVSTPATNTANVTVVASIQTRDASDAVVTWPQTSGMSVPPNTGWTAFTGTMTVAAGNSIKGQFDPFAQSTASGQEIRMRNMRLRKRFGGELVVDGSVSANKMTAGTYTGGEFIIGTGGSLRTLGSEVVLTSSGITIGTGSSISPNSMTSGAITATTSLDVQGNMTITGSGYIKSTNYVANTSGFSLSSAGLDIADGTVSAKVLKGGTVTSTNITIGTGGSLIIDATGEIKSNNWNGTSTGWRLSSTGLTVYGLNATLAASNITGDTVTGRTLTVTGSISSSNWNGSSIGWSLSSTGLTIYNGTIQGATVATNQLRSISTSALAPNGYTFSINGSGYAELAGANIYGNTTVGGSSSHYVQSSGFSQGASSGWKISGTGDAWFNNATIGDGSNYAKVYSSSGRGRIEFYDGGSSAGYIYGYVSGVIGGAKEIAAIGNMSVYGTLYSSTRVRSGDMEVRDLKGLNGTFDGNINFSGSTGMTLTCTANGVRVVGGLTVSGGLSVTGGGSLDGTFGGNTTFSQGTNFTGGITIASGGITAGGTITFNNLSGSGGASYVTVGNSGVLSRGAVVPSSIRWKTNLKSLDRVADAAVQLEPYTFDWTSEQGGGKGMGFIAEKAHELGLTEWVGYEEDGETPMGFDYIMFVTAQQAVLRKQDSTIKSLEEKIDKLEKAIATITE